MPRALVSAYQCRRFVPEAVRKVQCERCHFRDHGLEDDQGRREHEEVMALAGLGHALDMDLRRALKGLLSNFVSDM